MVRRGVLSKEPALLCPESRLQRPSPLGMKQWGTLSSGKAAPFWDPLGLGQPAVTVHLPPWEGDRPPPPRPPC